MRIFIAFIFVVLIGFASCSEDSSVELTCDTVGSSFAVDVKPIIDSKCATSSGCHASGSSNGELTTYSQIFASRVKVSSEIKNGSMPKNGSLTTDQKNTILCWIDNGALNN